MSAFPNKAGTHPDTDAVLSAELLAAGIEVICCEPRRSRSREVKTAISGELHQWGFDRAWYYWIATGPGIPVEDAEALHAAHGQVVRVGGHCGCPNPRDCVGLYHVDTQEGLNALAAVIRAVAKRSRPPNTKADGPRSMWVEDAIFGDPQPMIAIRKSEEVTK